METLERISFLFTFCSCDLHNVIEVVAFSHSLECPLNIKGTSSIESVKSKMKSLSWLVLISFCGQQKLFGNFLISPLSAHGLKPYFHRREGGKLTFGNILCTFNQVAA